MDGWSAVDLCIDGSAGSEQLVDDGEPFVDGRRPKCARSVEGRQLGDGPPREVSSAGRFDD